MTDELSNAPEELAPEIPAADPPAAPEAPPRAAGPTGVEQALVDALKGCDVGVRVELTHAGQVYVGWHDGVRVHVENRGA